MYIDLYMGIMRNVQCEKAKKSISLERDLERDTNSDYSLLNPPRQKITERRLSINKFCESNQLHNQFCSYLLENF